MPFLYREELQPELLVVYEDAARKRGIIQICAGLRKPGKTQTLVTGRTSDAKRLSLIARAN
jgi:translation initiation factor 1 (eIF-1/SUI1)